jgi:phosphatidate cytidylyltransferase|tara:strand:+ start:54 stop:713 length:660 start_codon:yes stop_codon:yes gene_type:complete
MPSELIKRILTSMAIFPLSIFFVFQGGYLLLSFLLAIFFIANYELFSVFKKISNILFLDLVLILALFSIYYLAENSLWLLLWVIILVICSDIGGYVFGKIFKWKKLTKISPKKTVSGVLGSFIFSLLSVFIIQLIIEILYPPAYSLKDNFLIPEFFFLAIVFSLVAQAGDLTISYFKRLEKIKDVGKILPGHGGIFDRIDGLIFVVIVTFIFYKLHFIP